MRFIEKLNTLTAVVVVFVFIVVVDGVLFYYRYQQPLRSPADVGVPTTAEEAVTTAGTTTSENPGRTEATAEFVHAAASENIVNNSTYIDNYRRPEPEVH